MKTLQKLADRLGCQVKEIKYAGLGGVQSGYDIVTDDNMICISFEPINRKDKWLVKIRHDHFNTEMIYLPRLNSGRLRRKLKNYKVPTETYHYI